MTTSIAGHVHKSHQFVVVGGVIVVVLSITREAGKLHRLVSQSFTSVAPATLNCSTILRGLRKPAGTGVKSLLLVTSSRPFGAHPNLILSGPLALATISVDNYDLLKRLHNFVPWYFIW